MDVSWTVEKDSVKLRIVLKTAPSLLSCGLNDQMPSLRPTTLQNARGVVSMSHNPWSHQVTHKIQKDSLPPRLRDVERGLKKQKHNRGKGTGALL